MNYSSEQDFLAFEKCNIIVSGIPLGESLEIFQREVHRRGFLIDSWLEEKQMTTCLPDDATESTLQNSFKPTVNGSKATIMLKISHDLQSKISLHLNISRNEDRNSSAQALARLDTTGNQSKKKSGSNTIYANEAIRILDRLIKSNVLHLDASAIKNVIIWLAHDSSFEFTSSTVSKSTSTVLTKQITSYYSLDKVAEYYGPYIGIYFGFLRCYTEWLIFPSILGLLLFGHQMYIGSVESAFLPLYGIIISIWSTLFVEFWRIRNAELNYEWNAHERLRFEDEADRRNNVSTSIGHKLNRQNGSSTKVTRTLRIASTCIILLALIFLIFYATWHLKRWKTDVEAEYANIYSLYRYLPVFCYSASAPIIGIVIHPVAKSLTMFERHQSSKDYQHNFILKKFALEFATRNSLLLYIAFWMQDLQQLRSTLISLLVTSAVL